MTRYLFSRRFEGNPRTPAQWVAWWKDRFHDFARSPGPELADAAAGGERLVARARLTITTLILAIPLIQLARAPAHAEVLVGFSAASVALLAALVAYQLTRRTLYEPWIGFLTSTLDVTLVSLALLSFLLIDQPHTVVNSKVVFEIYFLALGAAVLRFDPRICAASGALAVLQYFLIVWYTSTRFSLNDATYSPFTYGMFSWNAQLGRLILLACAGVLATLVTLRARSLQWLSARDRLTGLVNRSMFEDLLTDAGYRARRTQSPLCIVLVRADDVSDLNRRFGFAAGDAALRVVAAGLRGSVRKGEVAARYDNDVFAILLPETPAEAGNARTAQIVEGASLPMRTPGAPAPVTLHLSAGVAALPDDGPDVRLVLARAAERLEGGVRSDGQRIDDRSAIRENHPA